MGSNPLPASMAYRYKKIRLPDGRLIDEHRYVMEQYIGRELLPSELVHHINNDPRDNRLENLEIKDRAEHSRYHILRGETGWKATGNKLPTKHPSSSAYRKGCRCNECKDIERVRRKSQRARGIRT